MTTAAAIDILRGCGVELHAGRVPELHTSPALFRHKLTTTLSRTPAATQQISQLVDDLLAAHDDIALYLDPVSVAAPEQADQPAATASFAQQPDSLVRLLLGVDALQPFLVRTLLDKLPEFIGDQSAAEFSAEETKVSVKILRQLRWLDYIVDSAGLCEKLLETLGFVTADMQCEIISSLPNIISDADAAQVSQVLAGMLDEAPSLTLPILETLGCLGCPAAQLQDARNAVVGQLVSAEPMHLPVMVKFLLQSVEGAAMAPTIQRLRRRLDLDSVALAARQQQQRQQQRQAADVLVFDAIASTLRASRPLCDAWLRVITDAADEDTGAHTALDIVVLLVLHPMAAYTRRVEGVLRARVDRVSAGRTAYTPRLMRAVIGSFPDAFAANFGALLAVAGWLVRTSAPGSQGARVAGAVLVAAFGHMGLLQRQEIAGALAVHVGSGNAGEVDTAARVWLELAQRHPCELRPFAVFVKGLLDYVDGLAIEHVRLVFGALGILATLGAHEDGLFSDLHIYARKQLASVHARYNRIGIVGTVALLRRLGAPPGAAAADSQSQAGSSAAAAGDAANVHALRRGVRLLEMLVDAGRHQSWAFVAMTYDELAHVVETQGLHVQLLTWLHENVASTFAAHFFCDAAQLGQRYAGGGAPAWALALDADETAVLDIFGHSADAAALGLHRAVGRTVADAAPRLRGCLLACLPALVRLIQACEKALGDGSLADIDALLVCGIHLLPAVRPALAGQAPPQYAAAFADDAHANCALLLADAMLAGRDGAAQLATWPPELRRIACSALYVAANWVREIVNAFAGQRGGDVRAKVAARVDQLARVEACLAAVAASLAGGPLEFRPAAAGLVPELADAPAVRAGAAGGPRIAEEPAAAAGGRQPGGVQAVDVGGLLLSQDDARRLLGGPPDSAAAPDAAGRRGRKRRSAQFAAAAADDFARAPGCFLRELSLAAYAVLRLDDVDDDAAPRLGVHALALVLRELAAVVAAKLVRHAAARPGLAAKPPVLVGALATFASAVAACAPADLVARHLLPLLPALLRHLACCLAEHARLRGDTEDTEFLEHVRRQPSTVAPVGAEDAGVVERCIDALLQIVASVLAWDGLQNADAAGSSSVLLLVLGEVARQNMHVDPAAVAAMDAAALVLCAFDHLLALAGLAATAARATQLLRMLLVVRQYAPHCETPAEVHGMPAAQRRLTMDGRLSRLAERILSAAFADGPEETRTADLEFVIATHILRCPHSRLRLVHAYACSTLPGFFQQDAAAAAEAAGGEGVGARLTRATFAVYYGATIGALAAVVADAGMSDMAGHEALGFAAHVADAWLSLTKLTQTIPVSLQRPVLKASLRGSLRLIDQFLRHVLPLLDAHFLVQRTEVLAVFARVQKSTRILQNICNHSKVAKDVGLQASVPQVKRRLEQLVFQVVALMENNDCSAAINLGNLKHRDISGQVVGSQIPQSPQYSDEEEEEDEEAVDLGLDRMLAQEAEDEEEEEEEDEPPAQRRRAARPPVPMTHAAGKKHAMVVSRKRLLAQRREHRANERLRKQPRSRRDDEEDDDDEGESDGEGEGADDSDPDH